MAEAGKGEWLMIRIGVDLGGTKIEAIALGPGGEVLWRERVPTPAGDYLGTVAAVAALVQRSEAFLGERGSVGVGAPGARSPRTGLMKNCNSTCLNGRPFAEDLGAALGRSVRLTNDANCFALSEASDGAAAGALVVFGVILGTGVGGGLVVSGRVLCGPNAIAGEWGHNPLPSPAGDEQPGRACYCGRRGCIETWLSGPGLAADDAGHGGGRRSAEQIVDAARRGDDTARQCLGRYLDRLARALAGVINIVDPDVIVLGGGLSKVAELYTEIPARWGSYVFSDSVDTRLVAPRHGDASGVRGAAWLWP